MKDMTQEDKNLLLKDLCARLPYAICFYFEKIPGIFHLSSIKEDHMFPLNDFDVLLNDKFSIQWCKPYLRPMSSMTDEEYEQYRKFSYYGAAGYRNNDYKEMVTTPSFEKMDFLNAHHFDYRGLIEKGLALEAPEGMYNIKEK